MDAKHSDVKVAFPAGHFYSPIVDPSISNAYVKRRLKEGITDVRGVNIDLVEMAGFWERSLPVTLACDSPDDPSPSHRYYFHNGFYATGDGIILRAMIADRRPKKIIEVGSGFSTACMLDTLDALSMSDTTITCIEPCTDRLRKTMRPGDEIRLKIFEKPVQEVPLSTFINLKENDILFVDSTHVFKTACDVHYLLFYVLPVLKPGVIVHFYDMFFPFEYPLGCRRGVGRN